MFSQWYLGLIVTNSSRSVVQYLYDFTIQHSQKENITYIHPPQHVYKIVLS